MDAFGQSDTEVFAIDVQNVAPALSLGADVTVETGQTFQRAIQFTDPGQDSWTATINYGDGTAPQVVALTGRTVSLEHTYTQTGAFTVSVQVSDDNGGTGSDTLTVQAVLPDVAILSVQQVVWTDTGVVVDFTRAVDEGVLNLIDTQTGGLGVADVTLVGGTGGPVSGSLVLDASGERFSFIRTGGPLAPDIYTLTIRSGANGVRAQDGTLLDGNQSGGAGDAFITSFTVMPTGQPTLSLPDFVRGPGQTVSVPAAGTGLPLRISDGQGVEGIDVTFTYDPALLTITGVLPGLALPAGSLLQANLTVPGVVRIVISVPTPLNSGVQEVALIQASVPAAAAYRAKQILHFTQAIVNEQAALADDAVQLVSYIGDTTGTGTYSALDAQRILRLAAGLDGGFILYPMLDPILLADVTGNGAVTSLDATRILQEVVGQDRPEIPPLPGIVIPPPVADPLVDMPKDLDGAPGDTVIVPVHIDNADLLEVANLTIGYDSAVLSLVGVRPGPLAPEGALLSNNDGGRIYLSLLTGAVLPPGPGTLIELEFRILSGTTATETWIDLQSLSLNEGQLILTIDPVAGRDATDGRIRIESFEEPLQIVSVDFKGASAWNYLRPAVPDIAHEAGHLLANYKFGALNRNGAHGAHIFGNSSREQFASGHPVKTRRVEFLSTIRLSGRDLKMR
jgi:hypothetical protein